MSYNKRILSAIDRDLRDQYRSKRYSKSLSATNSVFAPNHLFSKPSPRRIYNPNAQFFQDGGVTGKYTMNVLFSNPPKYQIIEIETGKPLKVYTDRTTAQAALEKLNGGPSKNIDPGFNPKPSNRPSGRQIDPGFGPIFQDGGSLSFEEKMDAYADSSKLYDAYNFQRHKMRQIYPYILDELAEELQYPGGGKALKAARDKNIGGFGKRIYGTDWSFNKRRDYDDKNYREKVITDYYKKLIGSDPNFKIGDYSSPDLLHKTIKPIGTYFDGIANSPIYRKPTKPVDLLPPPPPPVYDIEPVYIEPEIERLDIIKPSFISNPITGEIITPEEEEGIDYERKFGIWLEDKDTKKARLKTFFKYKVPEFFNDKPSRVSQYYRTPKKIKAGFYNEPIEQEQLYPDEFIANKELIKNLMKFQGGGSIGRKLKKYLTKEELNVIRNAAEDYKKYATRTTDVIVPEIKKAQVRLISAADPTTRTILPGVEFTPDGKRLKVPADKPVRGNQNMNVDILREVDEEQLQGFAKYLTEEADLLKRNVESYLENPYAIDVNVGRTLEFDEDGFLIEPLDVFYHGIGRTSPGFNLETLEFDRTKIDPETMKGWTTTGNRHGSSQSEYGFFGALNKARGAQAALKYDGTREQAVLDMLRDPSIRPDNLGTIKEIGLSPNARLIGSKSEYLKNALKDVGIELTEMSEGLHIGGKIGMTPQKAATLKSKYGIDGIIDLGGDELVIINPDAISSVSDLPFKLFDYINPLSQTLKQTGKTERDIQNILRNKFGSSYINPRRNLAYVPNDIYGWLTDGADQLKSIMDQTNAYDARDILKNSDMYLSGGLRMYPYGRNLPFGLPFSEEWWEAAKHNLDLIKQRGGSINPIEGDLYSKIIMERNRGVDFVDRAFALGENPGTPLFNVPDNEQFGKRMSHKMAWGTDDNHLALMYPDILNPTKEAIAVPNQYADYISREGYKNATGMNNNDNFLDLELTDEEIQKYVDGGYIVEDLPKAQLGKAVKNIANKSNIIKSAVPKKPLLKVATRSLGDLTEGLGRGTIDLLKTNRKFSEIFPISKTQKEGVLKLQQEALDKGVKFVDDWFYTFNPQMGKVLRPEISDKILDIYEQANPRDRKSKYFYEYFRPKTGEKYNLGSIWDLYDHKAVSPLDNTPVYGVNTFGLNQNNPFTFTRNMLKGNTRDILNDPTLSDAQKIKLINTRATSSNLGTNYAHMPDVRLSVTDYKRGPYRFDPKHIYETAIHEATHTGQLLGTPNRGFGQITTKWDPDRGYYYANEDTPIGRFYKSIMPDKNWTGSPDELHAELMVARSRLYDGWKNNPQVKNAFKTDFNTGRTLSIPERDEKIKEWAFNELRNPTNQTLDDLIEYGNLNRFFKKGVTKDEKYKALRYLPGLAIPFALPSLTDDDKPKLKKGGALKLGDEVTEDMVEELKRQGYTLEEI